MICCWSPNSKQPFKTNALKGYMVDIVVEVMTVGTVKIVENVLSVATVIVLKSVERAATIQ